MAVRGDLRVIETDSSAAVAEAPPRKNVRSLMPFGVLAVAIAVYAVYAGFRAYRASRPYEWSGTVEARTIAISSRTGGRVKAVLVHEGDRVEAGQPLVRLEPGDLEAQRLQAEAQLAQSRANLEKLEKGSRPEEIDQARARALTAVAALDEARHGARSEEIQGGRARLIALQVAVDKAQLDVDRAHRLVAAGAISQAEADKADTALRRTGAPRDNAKEALNALENGEPKEHIRQAAARVQGAQTNAKLGVRAPPS